jgi:hypothetical protein
MHPRVKHANSTFGATARIPGEVRLIHADFISLKVFLRSICKTQFPYKSVNLFFMSVIVKDKLTNLWGSWLLRNDF